MSNALLNEATTDELIQEIERRSAGFLMTCVRLDGNVETWHHKTKGTNAMLMLMIRVLVSNANATVGRRRRKGYDDYEVPRKARKKV